MVLAPLEEGVDSRTVVVNDMRIVVCLHHIPSHLWSGKVVELIGASMGIFVERVSGARDGMVDFVRIRVQLDVTQPLKRGTFIRLKDGAKKWISFTYEHMPMYCYLCGVVGHMEKRFPSRYADDFMDSSPYFLYGVWLKAMTMGESGGRRLPLQRLPLPASPANSSQVRGTQVFGFGSEERRTHSQGLANIQRTVGTCLLGTNSSTSLVSVSSSETRKRKVITPSATRNRKHKVPARYSENDEINVRPSKKKQIRESEDFVDVPVVAAKQPTL